MPSKKPSPKPLAKKVVGYLAAKEAYLFKDDSVLVIYESGESKKMTFSDVFKIITEKESILNAPVDFKKFIDSLGFNLSELNKRFDVPNDISFKTLEIIDRKYPSILKAGVSEAEIFYPLVAFCGSLLIESTDGKWYDDINSNGEPILTVKGSDGKVYDPFFCIRDIIVTGHRPYSFQAAIKSQLGLK